VIFIKRKVFTKLAFNFNSEAKEFDFITPKNETRLKPFRKHERIAPFVTPYRFSGILQKLRKVFCEEHQNQRIL